MRRRPWTLLALTVLARAAAAGPYVAYVGNVPVHSASPEAKVMVADLATGAVVNVSQGLHSARNPTWAPDGPRLAFEAVDGSRCRIFLCAPDGSGRTCLGATAEEWDTAPVFVGSGKVAYLVGPDRTDLWLADLASGSRTRLTPSPRFFKRPAASPDGRLVAVTGSQKLAGPGGIFLVAADGGALRELTTAPALYSPPCFTPDGKSVVFAFDGALIGGARRGVAVQPVAGGLPRLLADDGYPLAPLSVSPDGARVAYTCAAVYHSTWVRVVGLDGSGGALLGVQPYHVIAWPSFSPEGKSLAFQGVYASAYAIHVVDLSTGLDRKITPEGETGVNPVFSPR